MPPPPNNIAPLLNISGSNTGWPALTSEFIGGICFDPAGNLFVGVGATLSPIGVIGTGGNGLVQKFAPGASGNATPTTFLNDASLSMITALRFDPARNWIWMRPAAWVAA